MHDEHGELQHSMEGYINYTGRVKEGFLEEVTPELSPQNKEELVKQREEIIPKSVDNKDDTQSK